MVESLDTFPDMIYERAFNGGKGDNNGLAEDISFYLTKQRWYYLLYWVLADLAQGIGCYGDRQ